MNGAQRVVLIATILACIVIVSTPPVLVIEHITTGVVQSHPQWGYTVGCVIGAAVVGIFGIWLTRNGNLRTG